MLLISTTHQPATDLGFLLHKNPGRVFEANLAFGRAVVFYPEAGEERTTAALHVEIDPVQLVRGKSDAQGSLAQYVNDRPYTASSYVSVAIIEAFGTAINGRSKERQELAETAIPLEVRLPVLRCTQGESWIRRLFEPLGYAVTATVYPLDPNFPEWGESRYYDVKLTTRLLLRDVLRHLYLLLPVLDARKHYYMDSTEVEKILAKGEGWLANHPERDLILKASLGRKPSLVKEALRQLGNVESELAQQDVEVDESLGGASEADDSPKVRLHDQRHDVVVERVRSLQPESLIDLGCGAGELIKKLIRIKGLHRIVGMDVAYFEVEKAIRRLGLDEAGPAMRERVQIFHGSLMYLDARLNGFDCCTVVEVIEHLDPPRLLAFEQVVFGAAKPKTILVTTPNREYNVLYGVESMRHSDHRFEWSRDEFSAWCQTISERFGYSFSIEGIGEAHEDYGHPSQMAVFQR